MTQLTPQQALQEVLDTWVSGISVTEAQASLTLLVNALDTRAKNDEHYVYVTDTQRFGKGIKLNSNSISVERYNPITEAWELGDLEVGHASLSIGSTQLAQYGRGIAYKAPLGNVGRVPIAALDDDGIGSVISVKVGSSRGEVEIQPTFSDVFAGTGFVNHLVATAGSVLNIMYAKSGTTLPDAFVSMDIYQGWRTEAEILADETLNLVYHDFIDKDDFGSGLELTIPIEQRVEFDLGDQYTVRVATTGSPFSLLGDSSIADPHIGGTQFVPYFRVDRTLQDEISFESTATLAHKDNVLELDNVDTFTPTLDYHPATKKYSDTHSYDSIVIVKTSADFGVIDSTKSYFIDGSIDMTGVSVEVPVGGISIVGSTFDVSGLVCADNAYTMFTSPVGGSGNITFKDIAIEVTGTGSQVYDVTSADGFGSVEIFRVNYNDCSSLGILDSYQQGLEEGTGRFGGSPSLTLAGTWLGGFRISIATVSGLSAGMTEPLFKAGVGFLMTSRFLTDINVDLPALAPFADFSTSSFVNSSTFELHDAVISRDGVLNSEDANIFPNILASDIKSLFKLSKGIPNTFVGGRSTITSFAATALTQNVWTPVLGTYTASDMQHYDSPANGQLRHLGSTTRGYKVTVGGMVEGTASDLISLKLSRWDNSTASFVDVPDSTQARFIQNSQGGFDIAHFNIVCFASLDVDDYLRLEVMNATSSDDVTAKDSTFFLIEER